jgi:TPR repeat protein
MGTNSQKAGLTEIGFWGKFGQVLPEFVHNVRRRIKMQVTIYSKTKVSKWQNCARHLLAGAVISAGLFAVPAHGGGTIDISGLIPKGFANKVANLGNISIWKNDMQKAKQAYRKGKYQKARKHLHRALKKGNFIAAWYLGHMHRLGLGVPANKGKAFHFYRIVALEYDDRIQNPRVLRITIDALVRVADGYRTGIKSGGIKRDYRRALRIYSQVASRGHPGAQYNLGLMYMRGQGAKKNISRGLRWINYAARKRYPAALATLGELYWKGKHLKKSRSRAMMMYLVATRSANEARQPRIFDRLDSMANKSSQDDYLLAERLAQIWEQRNPSDLRTAGSQPAPGRKALPNGGQGNRKAFAPE